MACYATLRNMVGNSVLSCLPSVSALFHRASDIVSTLACIVAFAFSLQELWPAACAQEIEVGTWDRITCMLVGLCFLGFRLVDPFANHC